ncbi:MAG TPA: DUF1614 domain-containing protein [Clostridia bacterium]
MPNYFPIGLILLGILLILMLFGVTQRLFDKLKISTLWAVILVIAIGAGYFIPNIRVTNVFSFNIGGFIIPLVISLYMLFSMGWTSDMLRAWVSTIITAGVVLLLYWVIPTNTMTMQIVAAVIVGIAAGALSYLIGRSRRGAFFSSIMGIYIGETVRFLINYYGRGIDTRLGLGIGSMFDTLIIAAVSAMLLAIAIGEIRDRMVTETRAKHRYSYEAGEFYDYDRHRGYQNTKSYSDSHYNNMAEAEHPEDYNDYFRDD